MPQYTLKLTLWRKGVWLCSASANNLATVISTVKTAGEKRPTHWVLGERTGRGKYQELLRRSFRSWNLLDKQAGRAIARSMAPKETPDETRDKVCKLLRRAARVWSRADRPCQRFVELAAQSFADVAFEGVQDFTPPHDRIFYDLHLAWKRFDLPEMRHVGIEPRRGFPPTERTPSA